MEIGEFKVGVSKNNYFTNALNILDACDGFTAIVWTLDDLGIKNGGTAKLQAYKTNNGYTFKNVNVNRLSIGRIGTSLLNLCCRCKIG